MPRPTSRIRTLQEHLRQARAWLQQIKDKETTPGAPDLDLDECLRTLDFTLPDHASPSSPQASHCVSSGHHSVVAMHDDMLKGHGRFVEREDGVACFYGAYSDVSFLLRTIELLEISPSDSQDQRLNIISDLVSRPLRPPLDSSPDPGLAAHGVPENAATLLDAVFARGDLMLCFLSEEDLRDAAANPEGASSGIPLLHMVLALGYLYTSKDQGQDAGEESLQEANKHFRLGMSALPGLAQDLTSLQTVLCAIIFLFSGYRTAMAHPLIGTACSSALRLGLLSPFRVSPGHDSEDPDARKRTRLLAAVLSVDMLGSLMLDLPPFLHHHGLVPQARLVELAVEVEARGDLHTAALLRQSFVLAIPLSIRNHTTSSAGDQPADDRNIRLFQNAHEECQRWKTDASSLMTKLGQHPDCFW